MSGRRRVLAAVTLLVSLSLLGGGWWCWDHRHYWVLNNFRVVQPGKIYAGGYQYPGPLARIVSGYGIRTVLCLRGEEAEDESDDAAERSVLARHGVRFQRVAIPYKVSHDKRLESIEQAVEVLVDPENQPVYVHCWAGMHRTGAVIAVYRVGKCGWTEEEARAELVRWGGAARGTQWPSAILAYYRARLAATDAGSDPVDGSHPVPVTSRTESRF